MKKVILTSFVLLTFAITFAPSHRAEAVLDCDWDGSGYCCGGERACSGISGLSKMCWGPVVSDPSECPF